MDLEEVLHLEPSDCIFIANSVEEIAAKKTTFDGCEVCERYKKWDACDEKRDQHVKSFHCNLAVSRGLKDGRTVFTLPCRKGCMLRGGANGKRSHYHCPFCGRMCGRRNNMVHHFKIKCNELKWKGQQRQLPKYARVDKPTLDTSTVSAVPSDGAPPPQTDYVVSVMEMRLSEWIQEQRLFGKTVNLMGMLEKARSLHEKTKTDLGLKKTKSFYGGKQWVKSFLERFGMKDTMVVSLESPDNMKPPEKDVIVKIIEKVSEKQVLYDPLVAALDGYNEEKEVEIWDEIAFSVGLESGALARQIWCDLEQKYQERNRPGVNPSDTWEYEHYMKFLPAEIILENSEFTEETVIGGAPENDENGPDDQRMVTVTIQDDSEFEQTVEDDYSIHTVSDKRVNMAKLRKIHLQMETMQQEHDVKMEMLQIEKNILLKKLNRM